MAMKNFFRNLVIGPIFFLFILLPPSVRTTLGAEPPFPGKGAKEEIYQAYWKDYGKYLIENAPENVKKGSDVDKAKYIFGKVGDKLAKEGVKPNTGLLISPGGGRLGGIIADGPLDRGTCGDLTNTLESAFRGAKIESKSVVADTGSIESKVRVLDVNRDHGAPYVIDKDGSTKVFDLWMSGKEKSTFKGAEKSNWNGMDGKDWGEKTTKMGYERFKKPEDDGAGIPAKDLFKTLEDEGKVTASWTEQLKKKKEEKERKEATKQPPAGPPTSGQPPTGESPGVPVKFDVVKPIIAEPPTGLPPTGKTLPPAKGQDLDMLSQELKDREKKREEEEKRREEKKLEEQKKQAELQKEKEMKQREADERWRQGAAARDRLIDKIKQSKESDPAKDPGKEAIDRLKQKIVDSKKSWEQMTPQERREALKSGDKAAWDSFKKDLFGEDKEKEEKGSYDPLSDPTLKDKDKPVDIAQVDKLSSDFQKGQRQKEDAAKQQKDQTVIQQPDSYTTPGKPSTGPTSGDTTTQPPYPPYPPPGTDRDPGKAAGDFVKGLPPPKVKEVEAKSKPPTTPPATQPPAKTASSAGIDIKVVGTAPPGKCNIVNGQLVPVEKWPVKIAGMTLTLTGPVNQTAKSSAGGTFSFKEIPAGDYLITVNEWNYGMTKQNFTAPSGKAIQITLKGSCPYLYVWTGEEFERENDIYSVARVLPYELLTEEGRKMASKEGLFLQQVSLEDIPDRLKSERSYRDYYRITKSLRADHEGDYRLKIKEQASEHSFTDVLELLAVPHKPGFQIAITRSGKPFLFETLKPIHSLNNLRGEVFPAGQSIELYDKDGIELKLPKEAFSSGLLSITWQGFQDGDGSGHTASPGRPGLFLQRKDPSGNWKTVDWVYPRDKMEQSFFILEDLGSGWDEGGKVRLVATSCLPEKYHRVDRIAWGRRSEEIPVLTSLPLISAIKSGAEDVWRELVKADGEMLYLGPGEEVVLHFNATPIEEGLERTFIFVSEGFYIPLPLIRLAATD